MLTVKTEILASDRAAWEKTIEPERQGEPAFRVRKNAEKGRFDADFASDLLGIVKGSESGEHDGEGGLGSEQLRSSLLAGLNAGQELTFIYRSRRDGQAHPRLGLRLRGRAQGATAEEAERSAKTLWRNLSVVLGGIRSGYRFAPATDAARLGSEDAHKKWIGVLRPTGVAVRLAVQAPIGFTNRDLPAQDRGSVIVTPSFERSGLNSIDAVVSAALSCESGLEVSYSITPVQLGAADQKRIAAALSWLGNGEMKRISYAGVSSEGTEESSVLEALRSSLNGWLKSPFGYTIRCFASSDGPIPASFMALLAGLFNSPVTMTMSRCDDAAKGGQDATLHPQSGVLDLQDCIRNGGDMPHLFPGVRTLATSGVKTLFRQQAVRTSASGILLGATWQESGDREVRFSRGDRSRHSYIVGATGTGKSTLLFNMIMQDIENGEGAAVLDPHGDLFHQVLNAIPARRADDVVLIDPCNFEHAVGINFLECNDFYRPAQMNLVANEMMLIFDRLYDMRATGGPIFEQYVRHAMLLAMENDLDRATLMDVPMIFEDRDFREYLKRHCQSRITVNFWDKQAETAGGESSLNNLTPYICSKLNQFTNNALLRPIIGQTKSTINFRKLMDEGKILLANLSKGMLGSLDCSLLGMLVMGKILTAGMGRADISFGQRRPFFLYVDEFQNFTTASVATLLSESRKFGVNLTLANQNLAQLKGGAGQQGILDSVLGNAGSMMIFRSGILDSEKLELYTKPELRAQDLQELPDFHVAGRLLVDNSPTRPFVFRTMPAAKPPESSIAERIRAASTARYARPRAWVEQDILDRYTPDKKDTSNVRKQVARQAAL